MSPQAKIIAGALGIVVLILVVCGVLGLRSALQHMVAGPNDQGHLRAVAAKIARFHIPAAYELVSGADLYFSQTVALQSLDGESPQMIVLQSTGASSPEMTERAMLEGLNLKGYGRCVHLSKVGTETFVSPEGTVVLRHSDCTDRGNQIRVESGQVHSGHSGVVVFAEGTPDDWESRPLRELFASLRPGEGAGT